MIANRHVNGDTRSTNRLNQPEKLFILGFFTITERTVAVDDEVSRPRIECDDAVGRLYKAFCYMLVGKMTPEGMKPDEAATTAVALEAAGNAAEAQEIYRRILAGHPDHALAKEKVG